MCCSSWMFHCSQWFPKMLCFCQRFPLKLLELGMNAHSQENQFLIVVFHHSFSTKLTKATCRISGCWLSVVVDEQFWVTDGVMWSNVCVVPTMVTRALSFILLIRLCLVDGLAWHWIPRVFHVVCHCHFDNWNRKTSFLLNKSLVSIQASCHHCQLRLFQTLVDLVSNHIATSWLMLAATTIMWQSAVVTALPEFSSSFLSCPGVVVTHTGSLNPIYVRKLAIFTVWLWSPRSTEPLAHVWSIARTLLQVLPPINEVLSESCRHFYLLLSYSSYSTSRPSDSNMYIPLSHKKFVQWISNHPLIELDSLVCILPVTGILARVHVQ